MSKKDAPQGFNVIVSDVQEHQNKRTEKLEHDVTVQVGPLPIIYSTFKRPEIIDKESKYTVLFKMTEDEKERLFESLIEKATELAKLKGWNLSDPEVETLLRKRFREDAEAPGNYILGLDQVMGFPQPDGSYSEVTIPINGPDNQPLEKLFLSAGSEGYATFLLVASANKKTKKLAMVFRLKAVKVSKPVFWEGSGNRSQYDDFSRVETGY